MPPESSDVRSPNRPWVPSPAVAPYVVVGAVPFAIGLFAALAASAGLVLRLVREQFPGAAAWWGEVDLDVKTLLVAPVAIVAVNVAVLMVEWLSVGWERSSLRRVLRLETPTSRSDFFYLLLRISGVLHVVCYAGTLGTVLLAARAVNTVLRFDLLASVSSLPLQFVIVALVNSFVFYWAHRLMHTRWFWEIHKVHHSAEELNVLTPTRNHPVDFVVMIVINSAAPALLGADPKVVAAWLLLNGLYQCSVHSNLDRLEGRWLRALLITPQAHAIHHSNDREHYGRNYGILTLWDRLFGTYYEPRGARPTRLGVDDEERFNTDHPVRELLDVLRSWARSLLPRRSEQPPDGVTARAAGVVAVAPPPASADRAPPTA